MSTTWNLPRIEFRALNTIKEERPVALLTGKRSWETVGSTFSDLPLVVQAEPHTVERSFIDSLADNLPPQVEAIYGVGGGRVADVAKYIGWKQNLPVTLVPTALSVDGFFTPIVSVREDGSAGYEETGPAERVVLDWDVVRSAPAHIRGTGIVELLSIVTGLLDWRKAAERNKNPREERFQPWAAAVAATIAQQAFKIAKGVGDGKVESLQALLDLICMEVRLTSQLGHTRPQEGSEQFFALAIEPEVARGAAIPYADLVGPGILIAAALHGQNVESIRGTIESANVRLGQIAPDLIVETLQELPDYVVQHDLPYTILNEISIDEARARELVRQTRLDRV